MNVLVVTNNPEAGERLEKLGLCVEFTDGNAKRSLLHARDLIIKGWHLAADPRGGYNKRYNPCHTVFLCDEAISNMGEDVLVLENWLSFMIRLIAPMPFTRIWSLRTFKYWTCRLL